MSYESKLKEEPTTHVYPAADIGEFLIVAKSLSYWCDFECYDCNGLGIDGDGEFTVPLFGTHDEGMPSDYAYTKPFLSGAIKWDGCANLTFRDQDKHAFHFCGRADVERISGLLNRLYDLAKELIADWDGD